MFALLLIVIGPIINFWGRKFLPLVFGLILGIIVAFIILIICSATGLMDYIDPTVDDGNFWLLLLSFVLIIGFGVGAGILFSRLTAFIGGPLLGFFTGFFSGTILYNLVFI